MIPEIPILPLTLTVTAIIILWRPMWMVTANRKSSPALQLLMITEHCIILPSRGTAMPCMSATSTRLTLGLKSGFATKKSHPAMALPSMMPTRKKSSSTIMVQATRADVAAITSGQAITVRNSGAIRNLMTLCL